MTKQFKLVQAGRVSLHLSIPAPFAHANKLKPGDYLVLEHFKIIRAQEVLSEAEQPVSEPIGIAAE